MPMTPSNPVKPRLRILVAEDSLVYQKLAVGLLSRQGHDVTVVGNGQDAVAASSRNDFDVVLMDIEMPVMDGLRATRAIRQREGNGGAHLPIIAVTTLQNREACLAAGMDGFLSKPLDPQTLDTVIHRTICDTAA